MIRYYSLAANGFLGGNSACGIVQFHRVQPAEMGQHFQIPSGTASNFQNPGAVRQAHPRYDRAQDGPAPFEPPMARLGLRHLDIGVGTHSVAP